MKPVCYSLLFCLLAGLTVCDGSPNSNPAVLLAVAASARPVPTLTGRVVDTADALSGQIARREIVPRSRGGSSGGGASGRW